MSAVSGDQADREPGAGPPALASILQKKVSLVVTVAGRTLPLKDLLRLPAGAVVRFGKGCGEPLELQVNGRTIGRGAAVRVGDRLGLRVTRIDHVRDVIGALAGGG